jgi:hypothetical protein
VTSVAWKAGYFVLLWNKQWTVFIGKKISLRWGKERQLYFVFDIGFRGDSDLS